VDERRSSAALQRYLSSAGSIINTSGFRFWIGTAFINPQRIRAIRVEAEHRCRGEGPWIVSSSEGVTPAHVCALLRVRAFNIDLAEGIRQQRDVEGADLVPHAGEEHAAWLEVLDIRS
jgi:hypothetical protein